MKPQFKFRNEMLSKIHIARVQLGIDESTYRVILKKLTGKDSCSVMAKEELDTVLAYFKRQGFRVKTSQYGRRPSPSKLNQPLMNKLEALLADQGLHWNYAHGMAQKMFNVAKVDWLNRDQLWRLVAALQKQALRINPDALQK